MYRSYNESHTHYCNLQLPFSLLSTPPSSQCLHLTAKHVPSTATKIPPKSIRMRPASASSKLSTVTALIKRLIGTHRNSPAKLTRHGIFFFALAKLHRWGFYFFRDKAYNQDIEHVEKKGNPPFLHERYYSEDGTIIPFPHKPLPYHTRKTSKQF